jgi:hypothetical protein
MRHALLPAEWYGLQIGAMLEELVGVFDLATTDQIRVRI